MAVFVFHSSFGCDTRRTPKRLCKDGLIWLKTVGTLKNSQPVAFVDVESLCSTVPQDSSGISCLVLQTCHFSMNHTFRTRLRKESFKRFIIVPYVAEYEFNMSGGLFWPKLFSHWSKSLACAKSAIAALIFSFYKIEKGLRVSSLEVFWDGKNLLINNELEEKHYTWIYQVCGTLFFNNFHFRQTIFILQMWIGGCHSGLKSIRCVKIYKIY